MNFVMTKNNKPSCPGWYPTGLLEYMHKYKRVVAKRYWNGERWLNLVDGSPLSKQTSDSLFWSY